MINYPRARAFSVILFLLGSTACHHTINTLPAPLKPNDPVTHYELEIPDALEVKAVSFDATTFGDVTGTAGVGVDTKVGGRAFLKVYAVHRQTGDQYLLLYEDIVRRKTPVQVVRFRPVSDTRVLDAGSR
jgi:hypothetical protein